MSLVPQFLTVLHHSAKVSVLNKCHAKFQGQTRNAFFPGPGGESGGMHPSLWEVFKLVWLPMSIPLSLSQMIL